VSEPRTRVEIIENLAPEALTELADAVTLDLLMRLEGLDLVHVSPDLSRALDQYAAWLAAVQDPSTTASGLFECLNASRRPL
jgi:hypothetical protein